MPSIRVVIRFRPINGREKALNDSLENPMSMDEMCPYIVDDNKNDLTLWTEWPRVPKYKYSFTFDYLLWQTNQEEAFKNIALPLVKDFVEGTNGTLFAYGQSGSGKSFSMFGKEPDMYTENADGKRVPIPIKDIALPPKELQGLIPRTCAYTFAWLKENADKLKNYKCAVSFYEIYIQGQVRDLLDAGSLLKIRDFGKGVYLIREGGFKDFKSKDPAVREAAQITKRPVKNLKEMIQQFVMAQKYRTVKATKLNPFSSRGHCIMRFYLNYQKSDGVKYAAMFNFADLAGSEKVSKSGATNDLLIEAKYINQSLTTLGQVINALAKLGKKGPAPPFRDSALSHCLKDSLVGNTRTSVVIAASPHCNNVLETLSSLKFGKRCKAIKTKVKKNVNWTPAQMKKMIAKQKAEIARLKKLVGKNVGDGPAKPYGPAVIFKTDKMNDMDEKEVKEFCDAANKFFMEFENEVGMGVAGFKVKMHVAGEDTVDLGIYIEKTEEHEMTDLLDFRDVVLRHCDRLANRDGSMFKGDFYAEDPLDPALLALWKSQVVEMKEEKEELVNRVGEAEDELHREQDRVQDLNEELQKLKDSGGAVKQNIARPSMMMRIGDIQLVTDDVGELEKQIEMFTLQVESSVDEKAEDVPSVLCRKALTMLKTMHEKVKKLQTDKMELEESLDVTKMRYDQILNDRAFYQEKLAETRSVSQVQLNFDEKRKPKQVNTAALWKKFANRGTEASFRKLVMDTAEHYEFLDDWATGLLDAEKSRKKTMRLEDMLDEDGDENDFSNISILEMTEDNVYEWVCRIHDGLFKPYVRKGKFDGMSGVDLMKLDEATLSKIGLNPQEALTLLDAIQNLQLQDPEELDMEAAEEAEIQEMMENDVNVWEKYLTEFHAPEVGLLQQLQGIEANDLFDTNDYISFIEVVESLSHILPDKSILCKIFSIIDTRQSGIISTTKLIEFIEAIQEYVIDTRIFTDVSPYTNYHTIIQGHSTKSKLTREGARMIVAELRGCETKMIRETDIAIDYLSGLNEDQLREFLESCPEAAWKTLSQFHPFERIILAIETRETAKSSSPEWNKCSFKTFVAAFEDAGIEEITEDVLKVSLTSVGVDYSVPMNFFLALNLLGDPLSDAGEVQEVMGPKTTIEIATPKNRIVAPAVWLAKRQERDAQLEAEGRAKMNARVVKDFVRERSKMKVVDDLGKIRRDYDNMLLNSTAKDAQFKDQESMLKTAMEALKNEKSELADNLEAVIKKLQMELAGEKKKVSLTEAARAEKSELFHIKQRELADASKELEGMKMAYEEDMKVSAEERKRRQAEIMEQNKELLDQKQKELEKIREQQRLLQDNADDMLKKYNDDLAARQAQIVKEQQMRNQLLAEADHALALRLQKEFDQDAQRQREKRRTQMREDARMASQIRQSRQQYRHDRGVSNADRTRFGTVRKKVASDVRMGEQVKTKKGHKGIVRFDGMVEGLGPVLGLDVFLGRGNHDGKYNGRRYFRCKKGRGLFVPLTEITHVYRDNKYGEKEKVRFVQPRAAVGEGLPGIGEDDEAFMNAATAHLGAVQQVPAMASY